MKRYFLFFITLAVVLNWTISTSEKCPCSKWVEQYCTFRIKCEWNPTTATCQDYPCSTIPKSICNQVPSCYYNGTNCTDFSSCSSVSFSNQTACNNVHDCQYYSGNTCSDFSCTNYSSNQTQCTQNQQCIYTGQQCVQAITCSQYDQDGCQNGDYCYWNGQTCAPATCSSQSTCNFVFTSLNGSQIQPCISDGSQCIDATNPTQFTNSTICFASTDYLYYWYSWETTQNGVIYTNGQCTSCTTAVQNQSPTPTSTPMLLALITIWLIQ